MLLQISAFLKVHISDSALFLLHYLIPVLNIEVYYPSWCLTLLLFIENTDIQKLIFIMCMWDELMIHCYDREFMCTIIGS